MKPVQKAVIALIVTNVIWGAASPIFKLALTDIPLFTLAFLRFFIAAIIMGLMLNRRIVAHSRVTRADGRLLLLYTVFGIVLNILFYFLGLKMTMAMNAPVIISSQPIMTSLFSFIFLGETLALRKFTGMMLGTVGMLTIILEPLLIHGMDGSVWGNLSLIAATGSAAIATIIGHRIFSRYDPLVLQFWSFVVAAALFLPLAALDLRASPDMLSSLTVNAYAGIFYGSVFSSTIAYSCLAWGLSKIAATDASLFTYVDPVAGTILAWALLHEPITVPFVIGTLFIFGGIFVAEGRIHYHPVHKLRKP